MSDESGMLYEQKVDDYDYLGDLTPAEWDEPFCKLMADAFLEALGIAEAPKEKITLILPDSLPTSLLPYWEDRGFTIKSRPATKHEGQSTFNAGWWAKKHLVRILTPSIWGKLKGEYKESR